MVTSEACLLVLQAGALSGNGKFFCLDMGTPVKVCDLATEMIRLAGYQPEIDIQIITTAPRPESAPLRKNSLIAGEIPTPLEKIFDCAASRIRAASELMSALENIKKNAPGNNASAACEALIQITTQEVKIDNTIPRPADRTRDLTDVTSPSLMGVRGLEPLTSPM